jgi:transposase-like protein
MDKGTGEGSPELAQTETGAQDVPETEEIRREIAQTREELGDTVEALAKKTDVKSHAKAKVAEVREKVSGATPDQATHAAVQVAERARERPVPVTAAAALIAGVAIGWALARR